jgi:hypothetical protein
LVTFIVSSNPTESFMGPCCHPNTEPVRTTAELNAGVHEGAGVSQSAPPKFTRRATDLEVVYVSWTGMQTIHIPRWQCECNEVSADARMCCPPTACAFLPVQSQTTPLYQHYLQDVQLACCAVWCMCWPCTPTRATMWIDRVVMEALKNLHLCHGTTLNGEEW